MADIGPQSRRTLSRESCALLGHKTENAFADFLSDGSSDEDEDDADTRALLRIQQQADDNAYSEAVAFRDQVLAAEVDHVKVESDVASVDDLVDLVDLVERASRVVDGHLSLDMAVDVKPCIAEEEMATLSPKRKTSVRETESAFADFLSDESNSSDEEDEDDADTRVLLRMQQQADDRMYVDMPLKMDTCNPPVDESSSNNSFRLTLAKPGVFQDDGWNGPKKLVEEAMRESAVVESVEDEAADKSDENGSFDHERPSFNDVNSFTDASFVAVNRDSDPHDSLASRPPSFDDEGDSFFDEPKPSFSNEHSCTGGGESFTDNSFVYRLSLPDDEEDTQNKVKAQVHSSFIDTSFVYRPSLPDNDDNIKTQVLDQTQSASDNNNSFVHRPTLPDSEKEAKNADTPATVDDSFVYRPTLPGSDDDKVSDDTTKASSGTSSTVMEKSFVYRPTLPDDDVPEIVFGYTRPATTKASTTPETSFVYRPNLPGADTVVQDGSKVPSSVSAEDHEDEDQPSFLSQSVSNFIRSSDAVAFTFGDIDSSFRLYKGENAAVAVEDDSTVQPKLDITQESDAAEVPVVTTTEEKEEDKATPPADTAVSPAANEIVNSVLPAAPASDDKSTLAVDTEIDSPNVPLMKVSSMADIKPPPLSRQSSVASSTGSSQQRRMTATRESWRVSSLDFRESKHAFDEELGPLAGQPQSPRASAIESEQQRRRLSSTFEERTSASSSFASFHSQANFFVDDIQQSFSSVSSLSLDSRPSGDDSFSNVAILGDDGRDENERRSSDIISQDVGSKRISTTYPSASETLDRSYSDLVDVTAGLDRSFSKLVDREGFYPVDGDRSSANVSANGTSLGSSLASTAVSHSSAASDELSFVSFNVAKPPGSAEKKEKLSSTTAPINPIRQKPVSESQQLFYRSIVLPRGNDVKSSVTSSAYSTGAKTFSSAALLAAIKTRDVRADTRSEETEAGDVALGALPAMAPPLKINVVPRGRGSLSSTLLSKSGAGSSPSISASPLAMSSMTRSSVASSTGTADRLDFTGVYRGSVNSLEASHNNEATQPNAEAKPEKLNENAIKFELLGVKLERSISDSRMMQHESQRKVEEFFRKTYQKSVDDIDEREVHRWTNRKTRAHTTVIQCVDNVEEKLHHFSFGGNKVAKIIDLKNLRNGGKKPGWHLEEDVPLTPQREDSSKQGTMGMTTGTTSTGTTATRSIPSDVIPMAPNYVISPQAADSQKPKVLAKKKKPQVVKAAAGASGGGGFFAGPGGDNVSRFGAVSGRRADNVSLTPTLPRLSANESPAFSPSPFVTSFATSNGFGGSGGIGRSPVAFAGTASGFLWKAGSDLKQSAADAPFDASGASYSQRPTLVDRVQSLSASLASTLRRLLPGRHIHQPNADPGVTSPQSQCTAPAALPRAYDHNGFYEAPFKVPGLNKPLEQHRQKKNRESDRAWTRQWLILATCAVLGLSLGAILVRAVVFNSTVFNLSADEVRERQETNGELVIAAGVRWFLLPGHLFVRVWTAVTTLLLFCYVVTGLADLVGCADKSALVLSFRTLGYTLLLAVLTALVGVLAMWMTHNFGWFRSEDTTAKAEASTLSDAIGVTPLPNGAVGLLCTEDGEYLQRLGHDVFACSNASLTLPLYEEVTTNSTGIIDSGPAVFALHEVTEVFATPTSSVSYYPASLGTERNFTSLLVSALTPDNIASQFTQGELDEMASLGGLIVFGLLLGFVCGKRILSLRRDAQAAMFESVRSTAPDPHKSHHYIAGMIMELQLALEWLVRPMERYLAPLGFFSLMLGHVVLHHREWRSFTSPMSSLIIGVLILIMLHAVVVLPIVLKQFSSRRLPMLTTTRAFVPAFLFAFTTDNVALSAPVSMQCYSRVHTVTRSAAQLTTAVTAALTRNARALYLPLLLLWLLETSSSEELKLSTSDYFSVGLLSILSSFCGGGSRLTLAMARTLWSISLSDESSSLLPATMPLLVVCDVILSRVASVVTVADHLVLTHLAAQHWGETVVHGPTNRNNDSNDYVPSPSPLDDSQAPRPSSSAMLSSVYL